MAMSQADAIAEIRAAEESRYAAMLALDAGKLEALFDDDMTYMHSSGVTDSKKSYLEGVRNKTWEYKNIKTEDVRIVVRGDTATVFCHLMLTYHLRGEARNVDSNALAVWTKASGQWRLLAVLSSARPK